MVKRGKYKVLSFWLVACCLPSWAWTSTPAGWSVLVLSDKWSWLMFSLLGIGLLIWNHLRRGRRKAETLRLEAKVALRTSQIQKDKRTIERQAESLRALDAKKSRFFANISHELRTPLTLMLGPIHDVLERGNLQAKDERSLRLAHQHLNKMLAMVNEILDLSKLDADKLKLEEEPVELRSFGERLLAPFHTLAEYRQIDLQFDNRIKPGSWYILDANKLERIINNLLSNALKFTAAGGWVKVKLQQLGDRLVCEVEDNGIGIAEADLPFVFDRYYQSEGTDQYQLGGTGIGLALVKELSKLMGGEIRVQSREGQGTCFQLGIPNQKISQGAKLPETQTAVDHASQASDFEQSPSENLRTASRGTILIVEDHPHMRQYICDILMDKHELIAVSNGQEAFRRLKTDAKIDLIITDVMMAGIDGFDLLRRLKTHSEWKSIPVIMLTARANQQDRLRALGLGAADYLLKPFLRAELRARVNNILIQRQELQHSMASSRDSPKNVKVEDNGSMTKADEAWLLQLEDTIKAEMGAFDFTLDRLSYQMAISRRQLSRKVKALTGLTVHRYVQEIKLQEAKRLLETQSKSTVKAIAYELGMKDVKYFSKLYQQRFGQRPSDFLD